MTRASRSEWRRRLLMVVLSPILLLAALEYVLWVFDVAPPPGAAPEPSATRADGIRARLSGGGNLVCLGGSTVAGAPFEQRMNLCTLMADALRLPLVNLAASAQDSSTVRRQAEIACEQQQALIFVSTGHNEFLNLSRFRRGPPPEAATAAARFLGRFRFYRLISSLVRSAPSRPEETGHAGVDDNEVYDGYEENLRAIAEACGGNHLMLATVISNPALRFPPADVSLREWVRARRQGQPEGQPWCPHCFRAGPEINARVRRVAEALEVPLVDFEPLVSGKSGWDAFWDQCHPRPDVHVAMAKAVLARSRALGWTGRPGALRVDLPETLLSGAEHERALYVMRFDPEYAVSRLAQLPVTTPEQAVGRAVGAFLVDDAGLLQRMLKEADRLLRDPAARAGVQACIRTGRPGAAGGQNLAPLPCMPWPSEALMNASEKQELVAVAARQVGGDVAELLRAF